jgi:hypothetical protein
MNKQLELVEQAERLADGLHDPEEAAWACTEYWVVKAESDWDDRYDARIKAVEKSLGIN